MLNDLSQDQYSVISGGVEQLIIGGIVAPILLYAGYYIAEKIRTDIKKTQDKVCNTPE
jgi:hypothetical protein